MTMQGDRTARYGRRCNELGHHEMLCHYPGPPLLWRIASRSMTHVTHRRKSSRCVASRQQRYSASRSLPERMVALPLDVHRSGDQGQVAERLGIIAQQHPCPRIDLF
jgi:hypothetical protein